MYITPYAYMTTRYDRQFCSTRPLVKKDNFCRKRKGRKKHVTELCYRPCDFSDQCSLPTLVAGIALFWTCWPVDTVSRWQSIGQSTRHFKIKREGALSCHAKSYINLAVAVRTAFNVWTVLSEPNIFATIAPIKYLITPACSPGSCAENNLKTHMVRSATIGKLPVWFFNFGGRPHHLNLRGLRGLCA